MRISDWSSDGCSSVPLVSILIARVDRERAKAGETVLTAGRGVALAYDRKGDEARQVGAMTVGEIAGVAGAEIPMPAVKAGQVHDVRGQRHRKAALEARRCVAEAPQHCISGVHPGVV